MIQIDRETFQMMLHQIMERFDKIDRTLERMNKLPQTKRKVNACQIKEQDECLTQK